MVVRARRTPFPIQELLALTGYKAGKGAFTSCSVVTGDAGLQQELKDLWASVFIRLL